MQASFQYPGTFNDLARWVKDEIQKLNRREILNSEIAALHSDIQELRMAITPVKSRETMDAHAWLHWRKSLDRILKHLTE